MALDQGQEMTLTLNIHILSLTSLLVPGVLKGFNHVCAWRPSWLCDLDAAKKKLSFSLPMEVPRKIWL